MSENVNVVVRGHINPKDAFRYESVIVKAGLPLSAQLTKENAKYIIKWDFVLDSDITVPNNCLIEFDGGSISNNGTAYSLTGQDTILIYHQNADDVIRGVGLQGSFKTPNPDWNESDPNSPKFIENKPTLAPVATSGSYNDLTNKPTLAPVATSGSYNDLTDKPVIPEQVQSDWNVTNSSSKAFIKNKPTIPVVPTNVSAFTNDANYVNQQQLSLKADKDTVNAALALKADKDTTYTKVEVNEFLRAIERADPLVVDALPESGTADFLYIVPNTNNGTYSEYIWSNGAFKLIGTYNGDIVPLADLIKLTAAKAEGLRLLTTGSQNCIKERYLTLTGGEGAASDYCYSSDYIALDFSQPFIWVFGSSEGVCNLILYNSDKEVLEHFSANAFSRTITVNLSTYPTAAYIRASFRKSEPLAGLYTAEWKPIFIPIYQKPISSELYEHRRTLYTDDPVNVYIGKTYTYNNNIEKIVNTENGYATKAKIPVTGGTEIVWGHGLHSQVVSRHCMIEYDSNGDFVAYSSAQGDCRRCIKLNSNTAYINVSFNKNDGEQLGVFELDGTPIFVPNILSVPNAIKDVEEKFDTTLFAEADTFGDRAWRFTNIGTQQTPKWDYQLWNAMTNSPGYRYTKGFLASSYIPVTGGSTIRWMHQYHPVIHPDSGVDLRGQFQLVVYDSNKQPLLKPGKSRYEEESLYYWTAQNDEGYDREGQYGRFITLPANAAYICATFYYIRDVELGIFDEDGNAIYIPKIDGVSTKLDKLSNSYQEALYNSYTNVLMDKSYQVLWPTETRVTNTNFCCTAEMIPITPGSVITWKNYKSKASNASDVPNYSVCLIGYDANGNIVPTATSGTYWAANNDERRIDLSTWPEVVQVRASFYAYADGAGLYDAENNPIFVPKVSGIIPTIAEMKASGGGGSESMVLFTEKTKAFNTLLSGCAGDIESFLMFTDPHFYKNYSNTNMATGDIEKLNNIKDCYKHTPTDFVLCLGDWLTNHKKSIAIDALGQIDAMMNKYCSPYYIAYGNHDNNYQGELDGTDDTSANDGALSNRQMINLWFRKWGKMYYTFNGNNTKFFVFDTGIDWDSATMSEYRWEQVDWFANLLLANTDGHLVIALHIVDWTGQDPATFGQNPANRSALTNNITLVAQAFNSRQSITLNGHTYNFASGIGKVHCVLSGHMHYDSNCVMNGIPVLTTNCCMNEECFDLVVIDYASYTLKTVRVGTGSNRTLSLVR